MKVTQNTPDILIVDDKPWLAGLLIGFFAIILGANGIWMLLFLRLEGLFFLAMSAAAFYGLYRLIERTQVIFNRPDNTVEVRRRSMRRYVRESYKLSEITKAMVETKSTSSSGGAVKRKVYLIPVNDGEAIAMAASYASGSGPGKILDAVNEWLGQN